MMIFFLLLTQFAFAEPPDLVAPVRKQQLSPLINCALDAEGLKCWLQDGGMFDDVKGQPRVIKRTGVVDFQLSEGGKYACWHTEKTVTCVASYYRGNPSPNPPYWLALNQVSQLQLISRQATTPLVCLHDTEASGRQREICAWMDGGWEEHVRYLEDKWNDGPAFSACEMDRYLGKLRANGSFEIGQFFDSLGIAHKEAAPIKVELESYYQHHSRWHPDPSGGWAEEWNSCNANYSLTLPSFTKDKQHDFPVNCETLLPTLKSTLPVFGCQKNPRARLSPLRERRNLLREVSFDEDWPDALKLLARERDMYNVQVQPGDQ
ncbi:MAG: hypothetical protein ACXWQO_03405 [Bdellovibrionota bacterium]